MERGDRSFPAGGGQLGESIRNFDWSQTSIGPLSDWPQSLRTVTEMLLLSPVPIVLLWGPEGIMIYNDAYSSFAGARHPELLGSRVREGWGEISDFNDNVMRVGLSGGTLAYRDHELTLHRHGKPESVWMDLDYSPVHDESGTPAGVIAIVVETTARVLAERRVRESERKLRALVEASSDVIYQLTPDWSAMLQLEGRSFLRSTGKLDPNWRDAYLLPEDQEEIWADIREAIAQKRPFQREHRVRQADGSIGWTFSRAVPIFDEAGEITEWFGAASDVTERRRTHEHLRLVVNELNHRVKNTLAMVQAIAMRTFREDEDLGSAQKQFAARLVALASANDLLTGERWAGASLEAAILQAVEPHQPDAKRRVLSGADLRISPKTALALSLAMHELSTNAVKYGAWSNDQGVVTIDWHETERDGLPTLSIVWTERAGPPVAPPARRGFGSRLIERGLAGELGGKVAMRFETEGLVCEVEAPLTIVADE